MLVDADDVCDASAVDEPPRAAKRRRKAGPETPVAKATDADSEDLDDAADCDGLEASTPPPATADCDSVDEDAETSETPPSDRRGSTSSQDSASFAAVR